MIANPARCVDGFYPPVMAAGACLPTPGAVRCSSAIKATRPTVDTGGPCMIAQDVGDEAGPTARHLDRPREGTSEMDPCAQV